MQMVSLGVAAAWQQHCVAVLHGRSEGIVPIAWAALRVRNQSINRPGVFWCVLD